MIAIGYMAKRVSPRPEWLSAPVVADLYSVSRCISVDFADWIDDWRHNGDWLFDSPATIREVEAHHTRAECSPRSCCGLAAEIETDAQCRLPSLEGARALLEAGRFDGREPGLFRILAVHTLAWPAADHAAAQG